MASGNGGRGPSRVGNGGVISSSDSSSSSNLSKPSNRERTRTADRKSPWSNVDRMTPKPSAQPSTRPSPRNTPEGWMKGGTDGGQQEKAGLLRLQEESVPDANSINRNAFLLSESVAENDVVGRYPQQPVITHQRNAVYPITRKTENPVQWRVRSIEVNVFTFFYFAFFYFFNFLN